MCMDARVCVCADVYIRFLRVALMFIVCFYIFRILR